jgi:hypothetical protein
VEFELRGPIHTDRKGYLATDRLMTVELLGPPSLNHPRSRLCPSNRMSGRAPTASEDGVAPVPNIPPNRLILVQSAELHPQNSGRSGMRSRKAQVWEISLTFRNPITLTQYTPPKRVGQAPLRSPFLFPATCWSDTNAKNSMKRCGRCLCGRSQKNME